MPPSVSDTPQQLQFFDILDVLPSRGHEDALTGPSSGRDSGIGAILGEAAALRVQSASVSFVGVDSLTTEVIKVRAKRGGSNQDATADYALST